MKSFTRDFGSGFICTITADDQPSDRAVHNFLKLKWSAGPPFPESIYTSWREWVNSINQQLSNDWNIRLFYTFAHGREREMWVYDPGKSPNRLSEEEAKIAQLTTTIIKHEQSALDHHDGSREAFARQLRGFEESFLAAHELEKVASDKIGMANGPRTMKIDNTEGKTRIIVNGLDSEVMTNLPTELAQIAADPTREEQSLVVLKSVEPGWIQAWFRQPEVEPELGRWTYYEVRTPAKELRKNPSGKSAQAYSRTLAMILGMAETIFPGSAPRLVTQLKMEGGIVPGL